MGGNQRGWGRQQGNRLLAFNNNFYIYLCHFGVAIIVARAARESGYPRSRTHRQTRAESLWICKCLAAVWGRRTLHRSCLPAALLACQTKIFNTCAINYCQPAGGGVTQEDVGRAAQNSLKY